MTVTVTDLARRLGLSQPAVSQILNGKGRFSAATRQRVQAAAESLGWQPNASARAMAQGRFGAIALVASERPSSSILMPGLLEGIESALRPHDRHLVVTRLPDDDFRDGAQVPRLLTHLMADGLLLNYNAGIPPALRRLIARHGLPAVWVNSRQPADCVRPDDHAGAAAAVRVLLERGHRRIAWIDYRHHPTGEAIHYSVAERRTGYRAAMRAAGLQPRIIGRAGGIWPPERIAFTRAWLTAPDRPTAAVLYGADQVDALQIAAAGLGLELPRDLSVIGFSSREEMHGDLRVDTMHLDGQALGAVAVAMLERRLAMPSRHCPPQALPIAHRPAGSVAAPAA